MISYVFLFLFLSCAILNIFFNIKDKRKGIVVTKPLLMPLLLLFYFTYVVEENSFLVLALIFGFLGDVFLLYASRKLFILLGLGSFLIGHILYIMLFLVSTNYLENIPNHLFIFMIPYILFLLYTSRKLLPFMDMLKLPSSIYMFVISIMSYLSLTRIHSVSFVSFLFPFIGSILFIISDTLLAFHMFKLNNKKSEGDVMLTYLLAQLFIVLGFII